MNESIRFRIRRGGQKDLLPYLEVFQLTASQAYNTQEFSQDLFDKNHFFHQENMEYWQEMASNTNDSCWWVAELIEPERKIVGGICLKIHQDYCEGRGFYVHPTWQGLGIGGALWRQRSEVVKKPIYFEVYSHATKTIDYHLRHGAKATGRIRKVRWPSWPEGAELTALEFFHA